MTTPMGSRYSGKTKTSVCHSMMRVRHENFITQRAFHAENLCAEIRRLLFLTRCDTMREQLRMRGMDDAAMATFFGTTNRL